MEGAPSASTSRDACTLGEEPEEEEEEEEEWSAEDQEDLNEDGWTRAVVREQGLGIVRTELEEMLLKESSRFPRATIQKILGLFKKCEKMVRNEGAYGDTVRHKEKILSVKYLSMKQRLVETKRENLKKERESADTRAKLESKDMETPGGRTRLSRGRE